MRSKAIASLCGLFLAGCVAAPEAPSVTGCAMSPEDGWVALSKPPAEAAHIRQLARASEFVLPSGPEFWFEGSGERLAVCIPDKVGGSTFAAVSLRGGKWVFDDESSGWVITSHCR